MMDNDPNASHDLAPLSEWLRGHPKRSASFCLTWQEDPDAVPRLDPWLQAEAEIETEAGMPYRSCADLDYGLANLFAELIAKTRPISRPEAKLPRAVLGNRRPMAEPNPGGKRSIAKFEAMVAAEKAHDPCEEGEG